jgi:hypothetical protein
MLRRHGLNLCLFCFALSLFSGCSSIGIKDGVPYFSKRDRQWEPDVEEDKWAIGGKLGRGNRALDDEHDPLKPILMSKEAQDIERNLGYK